MTVERIGEKRLHDVIAALSEGVLVIDTDCRLVFMNKAAERLLGWKESELFGVSSIHETIHPTDVHGGLLTVGECPIMEVARSGRSYSSEEEVFRRKDGERLPVSVVATPLLEEGRLTGSVTVFEDITQRKQAEEALRASQVDYREIFDAANDAIFVHDAKTGAILDVNRKMTEMYGFSVEEARRLDVGDLSANMPPYTVDEAVRHVRAAAEGEPQLFEWLARDRRGRRFWVEVNLKQVTLGGRDRVVAVVRDVTERKSVEDALKQKDRTIRRAYVQVIGAVTGGKLVLMTLDEIEEALGEPVMGPASILDYEQMFSARERVKEVVIRAFPSLEPEAYVLALGEALTNAVKHAGGGTYQVFMCGETLQVVIADEGPGIDFNVLPKATLVAGFSTKVSLGMGFTIMLEECDRVLLSTQPGNTTVVLEVGAE